ncbi:MAG: hypothetical protein GY729_14805 [Desulfobacteraceae bacterium]|nr:hypothetical protein [Desulfobacteraceae bacterium]
MHRRYDYKKIMKEIAQDKQVETCGKSKIVSQDDIQEMLKAKKKSRGDQQ